MTLQRARAGASRGFSLIEVIAAILLLALAFGVLLQAGGAAMRLSTQAQQYDEAALWARSLLDSRSVGTPIQPGTSEGRFDANYRWHLQVSPFVPSGEVDAPGALKLYRLDLSVFWGTLGRERMAHFSTLLAATPTGPQRLRP